MILSLQPTQMNLSPKAAFQSRAQSPKFAAPKADILTIRFGSTPQPETPAALVARFMNAAKMGDLQTLQQMLEGPVQEGKLNINAYEEREGSSALHWAVQNNQPRVLEMLMTAGADLNDQNYSGLTPLNLAVKQGKEQFVGRLLAAGADTSLLDSWGQGPLHNAAALSHVNLEILEQLLNKGGNPNLQNEVGATPLCLVASLSGNVAKIEALLKAGADPMMRTYDGYSAIETALEKDNIGAVELILNSPQFTQGKSDKEQLEIFKTAVFKVARTRLIEDESRFLAKFN